MKHTTTRLINTHNTHRPSTSSEYTVVLTAEATSRCLTRPPSTRSKSPASSGAISPVGDRECKSPFTLIETATSPSHAMIPEVTYLSELSRQFAEPSCNESAVKCIVLAESDRECGAAAAQDNNNILTAAAAVSEATTRSSSPLESPPAAHNKATRHASAPTAENHPSDNFVMLSPPPRRELAGDSPCAHIGECVEARGATTLRSDAVASHLPSCGDGAVKTHVHGEVTHDDNHDSSSDLLSASKHAARTLETNCSSNTEATDSSKSVAPARIAHEDNERECRIHGFVREGSALGLGLCQDRVGDGIRVWDIDTGGSAYLSAAIE
jgi:hypothetical protein